MREQLPLTLNADNGPGSSFSSEVCLVPSRASQVPQTLAHTKPKAAQWWKLQVLGRGQRWSQVPLTSPVHPPSDSVVYFPSGRPDVSLAPSPACPPGVRSKMTGTQTGLCDFPGQPSRLPGPPGFRHPGKRQLLITGFKSSLVPLRKVGFKPSS